MAALQRGVSRQWDVRVIGRRFELQRSAESQMNGFHDGAHGDGLLDESVDVEVRRRLNQRRTGIACQHDESHVAGYDGIAAGANTLKQGQAGHAFHMMIANDAVGFGLSVGQNTGGGKSSGGSAILWAAINLSTKTN